MAFAPSPQQQDFYDFVEYEDGNGLLEAVAGAGKTTTLVGGVERMLAKVLRETGQQGHVFLGAYNSKMADELRERIAGLTGAMASTFHAAGNRQLKFTYGRQHALRIERFKVAEIVEDICSVRPDLEEIAGSIPGIVSMAKQRGFGAFCPLADITNDQWQEMIEFFSLDENMPDNVRMDQVIGLAKVALKRSNDNLALIDFDDMVYLPLQRNLKMLQNDYVLIDEAQDTNPTRRALAAKMLKPGGRLIAVGDPCQAIFGFTGADNDSLEQIGEQFHCKRMPLTVTYRCPKAVVAHAQKWVDHIQAHESAPEGEVSEMKYDDLMSVIKPGEAILCRNTKYLVQTFFKLIRAGFSAKIEGKAIGLELISLAGKWKITKLDTLSAKVEAWKEKEVAKALKARRETHAERIEDKADTLQVLIERAKSVKIDSVEGLIKMIEDIFSDDVVKNGQMIVLCTVHRSKGLEWDTVYLLGRKELMPSPYARQEWQMEQERNLIYVAVTRAKKRLIEVTGVVKKRQGLNAMFMGA